MEQPWDINIIPSPPSSDNWGNRDTNRDVPSQGSGFCLPHHGWLPHPPAASPSSLSPPPAEPRTIPGRCRGGSWSCRLGTSGLPGLLAQRNQPLSAPQLCLLLPASPHTQLGPISFWRKPGGGPGARKQGAFSTDLCLTPDLVGGQAPKESEHLHDPVHTFSAFPPSHPSCRGAGEQRG